MLSPKWLFEIPVKYLLLLLLMYYIPCYTALLVLLLESLCDISMIMIMFIMKNVIMIRAP